MENKKHKFVCIEEHEHNTNFRNVGDVIWRYTNDERKYDGYKYYCNSKYWIRIFE